jgi:hypothetical protein
MFGPQGEGVPPIVHDVLRSPGQPLHAATRVDMEGRFGHDFSGVRVHTDPRAAASARAVDAQAYTVGNHIAFGHGRFAPSTTEGRKLLAHELTHVAQQSMGLRKSAQSSPSDAQERQAEDFAGRIGNGGHVAGGTALGSPVRIARAPTAPYKTPYSEELAQELLRELLAARRAAPPATRAPNAAEISAGHPANSPIPNPAREGRRTFAVAAIYDEEGTRLALISRFFDDQLASGLHAEEQIVEAIRDMVARGEKVAYTVMMVDQDPCAGRCIPLLKEFINDPATGTFRTLTPKSTYKNDPERETSAKTGYKRALEGDESMSGIRLDPRDPAAGEAFVKSRAETSKVRLKLYTEPPSGSVASIATPGVGPAGASKAGQAATADAAAVLEKKVASELAQAGGKDVGEVAAKSATTLLTNQAERRVAAHLTPVIGAAFSISDMLKGLDDIAHGNIALGAATIGVAQIEALSHFLHLTDEFTAGGGSVLSLTIQGWTTAMQLGFESVRIAKRSQELLEYIRKHNGGLPPRKELMDYYGLNDEGILILENDIFKSQQAPKISSAVVRDRVRKLLQKLDSSVRDKQLGEPQATQLREERAGLEELLAFFTARAAEEEKQDLQERKEADDKRSKEKLAALKAQASQSAAPSQGKPGEAAPSPAFPQTPAGPAKTSQVNFFGPAQLPGGQQLSPSDQAEAVAEWLEQEKDDLLRRADRIQTSAEGAQYRELLRAWLDKLNRVTAAWETKGSTEWPGVKRMRLLRDQVNNDLRSRLRVGEL